MTSKAQERLQRACNHTVVVRLREGTTGEWLAVWQCVDCEQTLMLTPVTVQVSA